MSENLWGGRFSADPNSVISRFNASIGFDKRLYAEDIEGSIAHATMLGATGIIPADEARQICEGLTAVKADIEEDPSLLTEAAEDIHMNVEMLLKGKIGAVAGKLHTGRSRNDQVATDMRLWLKRNVQKLQISLQLVQYKLAKLSRLNMDVILPGMTHMQNAQPVRLSHHLLAYFWMLQRDRCRLGAAIENMDALPLGAGALAGTTFPIDREMVREQLGFARLTENSMDAVSDRDFIIETLAALSILVMHLSRFCEELIIWNSLPYSFITLGDAVTTGSSIMPQKKNPDVAEHIRGKAGRVFGSLMSVLTTMKGIPLTYNGDMQEDKEAIFDAVDTVSSCLEALYVLLGDITFNVDRMALAMRGDFSTATDLADYLVTKGLPFREAHEVVGQIVADCIGNGRVLEDLSAFMLAEFCPLFADAPADIASVEASVERRTVPGGTARAAVMSQLAMAEAILEQE